jgi:hypothetical protein
VISDEASRAFTLISAIGLCKAVEDDFWRSVVTRIVADADERGDLAGVAAIRDMLDEVWPRLESRAEARSG